MNDDQSDINLESLLKTAQSNAGRGKLLEAEEAIRNIRLATRVELRPSLIISIMITEGCIYSYRADWRSARDRLTRAQALAVSQRKIALEIEALAWLAYVAFNEGQLKAAALKATQVMRWRESADPFTLYRASSVIAFLYFLADQPRAADQWLRFSKRMAELAGAPGAISSIIFAAAALRASSERVRRTLGAGEAADLEIELLLSRSAQNYDAMSNITIMPALHKLQEAQVLNMMGHFVDARELLISMIDGPDELPNTSLVQAKLELLWARWSVSHDAVSSSDLEETISYVNEFLEADDIIVYSSRIMQICAEMGRGELVGNLEVAFSAAKDRFLQEQKAVFEDLSQGLLNVGISSNDSLNELMIKIARDVSSAQKL